MADKKTIADFTELDAAPAGSDLVPLYDSSASAPRTRKITVTNLLSGVSIDSATTTIAGKVELATAQETAAGTSTTLAVTPAGVAAAIAAITGNLTVASDTTLSGSSNTSVALTANTRGIITLSGSATHTLTLPSGATNDVVERRIEIQSGATGTIRVTSNSVELFTFTATVASGVGLIHFAKHSSGWKQTGLNLIGVVTSEEDSTAPTASTYSPADDATNITVSDNLILTFSEPVQFHTAVAIAIKLTSNDSTFESFDETDIGTGAGKISISGSTLTINPTSSFANSTGYYVTIGATSIKDTAGNYFGGITSSSTWNFTTAASGTTLPSGSAVALDARLLSYADGTAIDNGSNKWTDASGNSNHGVQSTSNQRPTVETNSSESGTARVVRFAAATNPDNVLLTTPISLTGAFTLACKFKPGTRDGAIATDVGVTAYAVGIVAQNGSIEATTDGDAVDSTSIVDGGKYHSAPSGVFYNEGIAGNATFTTTIDGSGAINSVTIGGTNTGYDGTVTAVITQLGAARFQTGTQISPATSNDIADSAFHNLIVTRNSSNLVRWELDGTQIGTATYSGTISLGQIGTYLDGDIEAFIVWASDKTSEIADIRNYLG